MKQPIKVTVRREHGNSGDVITTITGADDDVRTIAAPGDCSAYSALSTVRDFIEKALNGVHYGDALEFADDAKPGPKTKRTGVST